MSIWGQGQRPYNKPGSKRPRQQPRPPPPPKGPFGPLMKELTLEDLHNPANVYRHNATVSDAMLVASFNWLDKPDPTILIPGKPPRWTPLSDPTRLSEDSGQYFRDKNAARYPKHPMEAAVLASLDMAPELTTGVNVVACGSTMGNLLRFVHKEDKMFRMSIELVDDTVFFVRRENSPTELIPDVRGFGHTFPEAYTTWDADVKGSASHQRVLGYKLGGLQFLVRFEADGYISEETQSVKPEPSSQDPPALDDLAGTLKGVQVTTNLSQDAEKLHVVHAGQIISQGLVFDLKTRSAKRKDQDFLGQELPRMWVAQIPKFVLAYHNNGLFNDIHVSDVRGQVKEWERAHQDELSQFCALVHQLIDLAKEHGKLDICHMQPGVLEIREPLPDVGDSLSPEVQASWKSRGGAAGAVESDHKTDDSDDADYVHYNDESDGDDDYTACSKECGYCGHCSY